MTTAIFLRPFDHGIKRRRHITLYVSEPYVFEFLLERKLVLNEQIEAAIGERTLYSLVEKWNTNYAGVAQRVLLALYPQLKEKWVIKRMSPSQRQGCLKRKNSKRPLQ